MMMEDLNSIISSLDFIERTLIRRSGIAEENMARGISRAKDALLQLERERDAAVEGMRELISRMNAGEDVMACEYCAKRFGVCNCNCLSEFELRGVQEVE